jgi:hypothetical protein
MLTWFIRRFSMFLFYPWELENTVNQEEEVSHTHLEAVQKVWRQEFVLGQKLIQKNQEF